jgi:hypothetical protein
VGFVPGEPAHINNLGPFSIAQIARSAQTLSIRYKAGTSESVVEPRPRRRGRCDDRPRVSLPVKPIEYFVVSDRRGVPPGSTRRALGIWKTCALCILPREAADGITPLDLATIRLAPPIDSIELLRVQTIHLQSVGHRLIEADSSVAPRPRCGHRSPHAGLLWSTHRPCGRAAVQTCEKPRNVPTTRGGPSGIVHEVAGCERMTRA